MVGNIKKLWLIAFGISILTIGGPGILKGQDKTSVQVCPIVQISLEPVLGMARFIPNTQFYTHRVNNHAPGLPADSSANGFISVPFRSALNFEMQLESSLERLSSLDSIRITLDLVLETDTPRSYLVPLPNIKNPSFETYSRIISNTELGGNNNPRIFKFGMGEILREDTASMNFVILNPKSYPSFFEQRKFAFPKYRYGHQKCSFRISGKKRTDKKIDTQFITIKDRDGLLVMLDEVIDPQNTITFSIEKIELWNSMGEIVPVNMDTKFHRMKVKFASDLPGTYQAKMNHLASPFLRVYRNYPSHYLSDSSNRGLYNELLAFRTLSDSLAHSMHRQSDTLYPLFGCKQAISPGDSFSVLIFDTLSIGNDPEACDSNRTFLGYASKYPQDGFVPLFHGKLNYIEDTEAWSIEEVYSLCLHHISNNPNYHVEDILCYVIPPNDGRSPCSPN